MDPAWPYEFRERMRRFEGRKESQPGEVAVSIKVRVSSGCFHREHSPQAYEMINRSLRELAPDAHLSFVEHESGPEILAYVVLAAAGLNLTAQVINLITAIIKARSEGIKKGDRPSDPLCLIVRRFHDAEGVREEKVLTVGHTDALDEVKLKEELTAAVRKLLKESKPSVTKKKATSKPKRKMR